MKLNFKWMSRITLKLSSLDLVAAKHVDGLALQIYDPANEYAKSIRNQRGEDCYCGVVCEAFQC